MIARQTLSWERSPVMKECHASSLLMTSAQCGAQPQEEEKPC